MSTNPLLPVSPESPPARARDEASRTRAALALAAAAATSIVVGILWDISWHRSVGRDTFWTPAHMAIYLGGALAGVSAAWLVWNATFGQAPARAASVAIGPLRGPLGAWVLAWGAAAMIASAPFDDWWHNAYGLDVRVISPPHVVLAAGMVTIALGAMLLALARQNGVAAAHTRANALFLYASGIVVTLAATFIIEYTFPLQQHGWLFYAVAGLVFPVFLVAIGGAGRARWPAAAAALVYMALFAAIDWILPLFPAQPRLAPVYNPITRMVPFCFPLLLVFPAIAIDLLLRHRREGRDHRLAVFLGAAFFLVLLAVQWPFGSFQMTPASRNWFFLGDRYWSYYFHPAAAWRYGFAEGPAGRPSAAGFMAAAALSVLSARVGLLAGDRLSRVRR
ncbi:MAG: hypothetical protein LC796_04600 [Acidobacteria bacterium]|nr:hypothetical protein [Acidobacteriota bacterium]MCA1609677.1 hypothetical protein [Acidobacteriota bacterium]